MLPDIGAWSRIPSTTPARSSHAQGSRPRGGRLGHTHMPCQWVCATPRLALLREKRRAREGVVVLLWLAGRVRRREKSISAVRTACHSSPRASSAPEALTGASCAAAEGATAVARHISAQREWPHRGPCQKVKAVALPLGHRQVQDQRWMGSGSSASSGRTHRV